MLSNLFEFIEVWYHILYSNAEPVRPRAGWMDVNFETVLLYLSRKLVRSFFSWNVYEEINVVLLRNVGAQYLPEV